MKDFEKALAHVTEQTKIYRETQITNGEQLNECLQQIAATMPYLETIRADYHKEWQGIVFKEVLSGLSVARAENEAHVKVPEMYLLRRVMDAAYEVLNALRSNISWVKQERVNSGNQ